ncbi:MAG: hypothetical protein QOD93_3715 [Acetobacteraceae bacterium]|jgi:SOS response associated peptidase (SRAP)|nr:hypothetical protein [Acetobacteraceae bacterium]MEA2770753.1 hypothetical protein [Acetobacteraceae bacterium]
MFKAALAKRRCLVPAAAFYEWKATPDGKVPHAIARADGEMVAFAGLWEGWRSPEGDVLRSFVTSNWLRVLVGVDSRVSKGRDQPPGQQVEMPLLALRMPAHHRRAHGRRHVPGRPQVGRRVLRPEQAGDEFRREPRGQERQRLPTCDRPHAKPGGCVVLDPGKWRQSSTTADSSPLSSNT